MNDIEYAELLENFEYIKNFNVHFNLLLRRYERFNEVNKVNNKDIDVITYLDMIIVQLRAMCIENTRYKNNYTVQILLRKVGENELAQKIDYMLSEKISEELDIDVKTGFKIVADEFICHYDNFDGDRLHRLSLAEIIANNLRNPYRKINLDYIMKVITESVAEGLAVKLE